MKMRMVAGCRGSSMRPAAVIQSSTRIGKAAMAKARKKVQPQRKTLRPAIRKKTRSAAARARKPKQKFTVSHHREEDFDAGLRTYSAYRDLGLAPATGGLVQAHVIRMTRPFDAGEVAIPH